MGFVDAGGGGGGNELVRCGGWKLWSTGGPFKETGRWCTARSNVFFIGLCSVVCSDVVVIEELLDVVLVEGCNRGEMEA